MSFFSICPDSGLTPAAITRKLCECATYKLQTVREIKLAAFATRVHGQSQILLLAGAIMIMPRQTLLNLNVVSHAIPRPRLYDVRDSPGEIWPFCLRKTHNMGLCGTRRRSARCMSGLKVMIYCVLGSAIN